MDFAWMFNGQFRIVNGQEWRPCGGWTNRILNLQSSTQMIPTMTKIVAFVSDSGSESGSHKGGGGGMRKGGGGGTGSDGKPTRVRTVLNEKQLHTLRTCYAANPRPDALMKEQLVEMTGLSPRVIRVWFQNKRCKDKKKTLLMKQQMQQEKVGILAAEHWYCDTTKMINWKSMCASYMMEEMSNLNEGASIYAQC